jgi:hypothetical protein
VDKRTGYRTKQMLVAPVLDAAQRRAARRRPADQQQGGHALQPADRRGRQLAQTLAIAFKQRQKQPQRRKDQVRLPGRRRRAFSRREFDLATRSARRKGLDIEEVLIRASSRSSWRPSARRSASSSACPTSPSRQDRIKPMDLLKNLKREYVEANQWLPIEDGKEGLVVLCRSDPERVKTSRIVNNVFPKASSSFA